MQHNVRGSLATRHLDVTGASDGNSIIIADDTSSTYTVNSPGIYDTTGVVPYPDGANGEIPPRQLLVKPGGSMPLRDGTGRTQGPGPDMQGPGQIRKPARPVRKSDATYIYTSCTQLYQAKTPGVHDPSTDIPLGDPSCISFSLSTGTMGTGPSFYGGAGTVGYTSQVQCESTDNGQSWGCSTSAHCQMDYKKDMSLAPHLIAARLYISGVTAVFATGVISAGIGAAVAAAGEGSALAIWGGSFGLIVGSAGMNMIMSALTNMTLHDALMIEAQAGTLHQDEVNNGCATDANIAIGTLDVTRSVTPGSW